MPDDDLERTEEATPRRRQEAREEGQVARSVDLTAASMLLGAILLLDWFGLKIFAGMKRLVALFLSGEDTINPTRLHDASNLHWFLGRIMLEAVAPVILGITAIALLVTIAQVGFMVTTKPLAFNPSKLSPIKGVKRLVDARAAMRLVMSLAKVLLIILVASIIIYLDLPHIFLLPQLDLLPMFGLSCQLVYGLALKLAALLLVLAIGDYVFQRWQLSRDLRMTKQQVKEEYKRMEGDPLIKQRRARVARQLAMQRVNRDVPRADVVVTNPTHYAIALKYDAATMKAPKVIAKGADFMAMRIRQVATAHGIPLIERKPLAQALYRGVEVGQEVPPEFYNAVAEILAYVYRLDGRKIA